MEKDRNDNQRDALVYTAKLKAGKRRTYFFDIRKTKGNDYYLSLTESTKTSYDDQYKRHKVLLYKEDFNRFEEKLKEVLDEIRLNLMPDYDYEAYLRRDQEYEQKLKNEEGSDNREKDTDDDEVNW